jgi:hypothetical protein
MTGCGPAGTGIGVTRHLVLSGETLPLAVDLSRTGGVWGNAPSHRFGSTNGNRVNHVFIAHFEATIPCLRTESLAPGRMRNTA